MKNNYRQRHVLTITFALLLTYYSPIFSQTLPQKTISGTITDADGPLSGVNVLVKNTSRGSISDLAGRYEITASSGDTLLFTYLGYKTQEARVGATSIFNITMEPDATVLDQVIINAGYYKVSDREKTGSISSITAKTIENQVIVNPIAALQGRMGGVFVSQASGLAGSGIKIQIRGQNSISAGNAPLYVIDGVPFSSQTLSAPDLSGSIIPYADLSPFSFLSPADIESIEVLKDADATAIYGSRAANGVVLITTKNGAIGQTAYSFTAKSSLGQVAHFQKLLNTQQYLEMRRQAYSNDGIDQFPSYAYDVNGTWDKNRYTNWQKEFLGGTAFSTEYNTTVKGGDKKTSFLISGGLHRETTVFPGDDSYTRVNGLAKISHSSPEDKFKLSLSTAYTYERNKLLGSDLSYQALTLAPNAPNLYNADGTLNWEDGTFNNPLAQLDSDYFTTQNSLLVNGLIDVVIFKNMNLRTNLGYQNSNLSEVHTYPFTIFPPSYGLNSSNSALYINEGARNSWVVEPQLNFNFEYDKSKLEFLVGYSAQKDKTENFSQFAEGFANNEQILNIAAANYIKVNNDAQKIYNYQALFGRVNYNFASRYILNLTGRRDGSSRFGPENRFANFGAVGAAWLFSEEKRVKEKVSFLNYGKLRASYGSTGNDQIGDYSYLKSYSNTGTPYNGTVGLYPTALYNPDFGWEENRKAEIALELGAFKNRIRTNINYYRNRSSNQLVEVPLPGTTGFSGILANLDALVENRGWEFEINTLNINSEKWKWTTSINFTLPKNELLEFPNLENSTYANRYVIGEPISIQKVLHFTGVDPQTGIYSFEDVNGDGQISAPEDNQTIIDTAPKYYGGVSNTLTFGNLQLDIFFQFSKQMNFNINSFGTTPGVMANQPVTVLDAWSIPGDQTDTQAFTSGSNYERSMAAYNLSLSDAAFSNAGYVRLKNISLSYTLSNSITKLSDVKVFIQGQNLYTWTNFKEQDPEQTQGFLPALRWLGAGLTLTF